MKTHFTYTDRDGKQLRHRIVKRKRGTKPRNRVICFEGTGSLWEIDEHLSLTDIEQGCPMFFRCPHGRRETYTVYRGQLIVRNTVQFTGCRPQRKTTVYLVTTHEVHRGNWRRTPNFETFCLGSDYSTIYQAQRAIDRVLDGGCDEKG